MNKKNGSKYFVAAAACLALASCQQFFTTSLAKPLARDPASLIPAVTASNAKALADTVADDPAGSLVVLKGLADVVASAPPAEQPALAALALDVAANASGVGSALLESTGEIADLVTGGNLSDPATQDKLFDAIDNAIGGLANLGDSAETLTTILTGTSATIGQIAENATADELAMAAIVLLAANAKDSGGGRKLRRSFRHNHGANSERTARGRLGRGGLDEVCRRRRNRTSRRRLGGAQFNVTGVFNMIVKRGLLSVVFLALAFNTYVTINALEVKPFLITSARENAMGGTHAALADDFSALFSNPAGFVSAKNELSVAELTIEAYGPLFDLIDSTSTYLKSGKLDLSGLVGKRGLQTGLDLVGPLSFGWVGRGLGFGVFNRSNIGASAQGMTIGADASEDMLLVGGYAFRFSPGNSHDIDIGFQAKGFLRGSLALESSILTVTDMFSGDIASTRPFTSTAGVGLDLGIRYEFAKTLAAALVCRDVYSPALVTNYSSINAFLKGGSTATSAYGTIDPQLDFGVEYKPRFPVLERYITGLVFALDYRDLLDLFSLIPRHPILNVGFGVELVLLDVLSFRAGISDALPCAGFGLDLKFMRFDFTMRGIEYGLDPGFNSIFAMDLGLLFRY